MFPFHSKQPSGTAIGSRLASGLLSLLPLASMPAALAQAVAPAPAVAAATRPRVLSVTGEGQAKLEARDIDLALGIDVRAKSALQAQQALAKAAEGVEKALRSHPVRDLKTSGISFSQTWRHEPNGSSRPDGYQGSATVSFRAEAARAGALLDDAFRAGANRIDGVSPAAADEELERLRKEALRLATLDARRQADAVLSALGLKIEEIVGVQVNNARAPGPVPMEAYALDAASEGGAGFAGKAARSTLPVRAGRVVVEAAVTLQVRY